MKNTQHIFDTVTEKFDNVWVDHVDCPHHEGEGCKIDHYNPIKSFLVSTLKELLAAVYKDVNEMKDRCDCLAIGKGETHYSQTGCPDKTGTGYNQGLSSLQQGLREVK